MDRRSMVALGACVFGLFAGSAEGSAPPRLRLIEQTVADADELAVSFRVLNNDLRDPAGWSQLFEDTQNPGTFVRINGAVCEVSSTTRYITNRDGTFADVAPGTVYYIGGMPEAPAPRASAASRGLARPRAVHVRNVVLASDVMLAQIVAPSALRAIDAERDESRRIRESVEDAAAQAATPRTDLGEDEADRARRLREISDRLLTGG